MDAGRRSLPALATWENETTYSALRFQPCAGRGARHPTNAWRSCPRPSARRSPSPSRTAHTRRRPRPPTPPRPSRRRSTTRRRWRVPRAPVDVLVPAGDVQLLGRAPGRCGRPPAPLPRGHGRHAEGHEARHRSHPPRGRPQRRPLPGAELRRDGARSQPQASGIWSGDDGGSFVHDVLVVGDDVAQSASAHVFGQSEEGGVWAFNYAHDGYADTFTTHRDRAIARSSATGRRPRRTAATTCTRS